jgi:hypothetical protein
MKLKTCSAAVRKALFVGGLWAGALSAAQAAVVTYGFDTLIDSESVTNQFAGLSFANATVLTAGISLNDFEFPPSSGTNVLVDEGGPMEILFSSPVFSVGAAFTYSTSLSFSIYDAADVLLGTVVSLGNSNLAVSGEGFAVNELLSFSSVGGAISRLVISGDSFGGSFVMDDLTVDFGTAAPVPEPATLALVAGLLGLGVLPGGWMRRTRPH